MEIFENVLEEEVPNLDELEAEEPVMKKTVSGRMVPEQIAENNVE